MSLTYNFADIGPPGAIESLATGINNVGQVVGSSGIGGFLFSAGAYTPLSFTIVDFSQNTPETIPGYFYPSGINDAHDIVGPAYFGSPGGITNYIYSGGTYTFLHINAFNTSANGINNAGEIVGAGFFEFSVEFSGYAGFLYSSRTITTFQDPVAVPGSTFANGINNEGSIVGYYQNSASVAHGFLYSGGTFTTLDDPLATGGTYLTGINDTGQIVGSYIGATGQHGFLYDNGTFTTLDNPLGVTEIAGINDSGQIVGNYLDSAGYSHGFFGTTDTIIYTPLAFSADTAGEIVYGKEYGVDPNPDEHNILVAFTTSQYAYGQQIGVMDPVVYAYEALGVALASTATHFENTFGTSNPAYPNSAAGDAQFAADSYASVFGHPGTSAQVQHFVDQLNFFEALYTASGSFGSAANVDLLARGAIYGQMLGVQAELLQVPIIGVSATSVTHDAFHS
jgi:probable HAF family extracellular repeat protein